MVFPFFINIFLEPNMVYKFVRQISFNRLGLFSKSTDKRKKMLKKTVFLRIVSLRNKIRYD